MRPCCYCLTMGAWGTANNKPTRHCLTSLITQSVNSSKRTHVKKRDASTIPGTLYSANPLEELGLPAKKWVCAECDSSELTWVAQ